MIPIGGFFELELNKGKEYYPDLLALNTGRNALEYILKVNSYKRIYIPYFTCDVILEPFKKLNIEYVFYHINEQLEVADDILLAKDEALLYTNYFGIKNGYVRKLSKKIKNLIVDNAQSFFSFPIKGTDTFYSCRKFFGIPDGAYVNFKVAQVLEMLNVDISHSRFLHLLKRIDEGAESAYADFKKNDNSLIGQPVLQMSLLTKSILKSIDYSSVKAKRNKNFSTLHRKLGSLNELKCIHLESVDGPMVYPFLIKKNGIKERLLKNKIFVATYWPNVKEWCKDGSVEKMFYDNLIALPVDQRYAEEDMNQILKIILE